MFLIKTRDKLKFDVKENVEISYSEFNLSPAHANKKIKLKKKRNK